MTLPRDPRLLTLAHLEALLALKVEEGRELEYKVALPGPTESDKREFLADVSSLANTGGGWLLFGVAEAQGVPTELVGVECKGLDDGILRLENLLRDGLRPRLAFTTFVPLRIDEVRSIVAVNIAQSWHSPHMVALGGSCRFYARNNRGKYPLDIDQIRAAFLGSATLEERVASFRVDRLLRIKTGAAPVTLHDGPRVVVHLVPLTRNPERSTIDPREVFGHPKQPALLYAETSSQRFNLAGALYYATSGSEGHCRSYLQVFRDGSIEAVSATLIQADNASEPFIRSVPFEEAIIDWFTAIVPFLQTMQLSPPWAFMLSLLGVGGFKVLPMTRNRAWDHFRVPIPQDDVVLPELLVPNAEVDPAELLRPPFDMIWQAAGWALSHNYGSDGKRIKG